eukprot:comp12428_c0_seq1/m.7338 comp12428_c0_seq1/g.7338  ORF comp12428_c0_seq1/g.7338 comp12428_c0_seq1/m.7338 type:complete len:341 (-) comp12428_c0_seq1:30-1052(-)
MASTRLIPLVVVINPAARPPLTALIKRRLASDLPPGYELLGMGLPGNGIDSSHLHRAEVALFAASGNRAALQSVWGDLTQGPNPLKWMHVYATGMDGIWIDEISQPNAPMLTNGQGASADALAEFALGGCVHFTKQFEELRKDKQERRYNHDRMVGTMKGRNMLVVGYGGIGKRVAQMARALGLNVTALRRRPELGADGVTMATMDQLHSVLPTTHYLVSSLPLTLKTRGLFGKNEISLLPEGAVVVNVGRGAVFDEDALAQALTEGRLGGAALDVFAKEPLPADHAFWSVPDDRIIISPHNADNNELTLHTAMDIFFANCNKYAAGERLEFRVDPNERY